MTPRKNPCLPGRLAAAVFAIWTAAFAYPAPSSGGDSLQYAVEAAYLYKFGEFVEWPSTAFASPVSAVNVCVAGADPFGANLDTVASGQHIGVRAIVVRHLAAA